MHLIVVAKVQTRLHPCSGTPPGWSDRSGKRGRSPWGGDAISVTDADAPLVVLATEDRRDPEVQGHELVAASALDVRMFDGHNVAEIVTCPPGNLIELSWLTANEHQGDPRCFGCDEREPDDWRTEGVGQDAVVAP